LQGPWQVWVSLWSVPRGSEDGFHREDDDAR